MDLLNVDANLICTSHSAGYIKSICKSLSSTFELESGSCETEQKIFYLRKGERYVHVCAHVCVSMCKCTCVWRT